MSHRILLISAALAACASLTGVAQADIVAVDSGIAVRPSDGIAPTRGMTMSQVASKFGAPVSKVPPVGKPPISRWEYPGFIVYFEHDHVIHSVVSESAAPPAQSAPQATTPAETPAASATVPAAPAAQAAPAESNTASPAPAAAEPVEPPPAP